MKILAFFLLLTATLFGGASFSSPSTARITTTYSATGTLRSVSLIVRRRGLGGGSLGRVYSKWTGNATGEEWFSYFNGGHSNLFEFQISRSTNDVFTIPGSATTNVWMQLGVDWDSSNSAIPLVYNCWLNGVLQTPGVIVNGNGAFLTNSSDDVVLGNRNDNVRNFDGDIAEFAVWNRRLTSAEWAMLGQFVSPLRIPNGLVCYVPLYGAKTVDYKNAPGTLSGATENSHPNVRR